MELQQLYETCFDELQSLRDAYSAAIRGVREEGTKSMIILRGALFSLENGSLVVPTFEEYFLSDGTYCWEYGVTIVAPGPLHPFKLITYYKTREDGMTGSVHTMAVDYSRNGPSSVGITTDLFGDITDGSDNWLLDFQRFATQVVSLSD